MNLYQQKYLKYKTKYELLKKQIGGNKRILKDLETLKKNPLSGIIVERVEGNMFLLHGTITGPPDSPYEGYMWKIRMNIPQDYPFSPPTVNFVDKIFHPNISYDNGDVCISILKNNQQADSWNPILTIGSILLSIQSMFTDANPDSPLNWNAADLYRNNKEEFNKKVRTDAERYAVLAPPQ